MGYYRLILALLVAASHAGLTFGRFNPGEIAVVSFFLLSGYVMTALIDRHYAGFAARRSLLSRPRAAALSAISGLFARHDRGGRGVRLAAFVDAGAADAGERFRAIDHAAARLQRALSEHAAAASLVARARTDVLRGLPVLADPGRADDGGLRLGAGVPVRLLRPDQRGLVRLSAAARGAVRLHTRQLGPSGPRVGSAARRSPWAMRSPWRRWSWR